jgi:hypothetical protein
MRAVGLGVISAMLAACVTVGSNVVPVGKDTYQLSMTGIGFATQANTNIKALKAANDCRTYQDPGGNPDADLVRLQATSRPDFPGECRYRLLPLL